MANNKDLMKYDNDYNEPPKPAIPFYWLPRKLAKKRLKDQLEIATYMASIAEQLRLNVQRRSEAEVIKESHEDKIKEAHEIAEHRRRLREIEIQKGQNEVLAWIISNNTNKQKQLQAEIETMNHQFEYEQKLKGVGVENVITVEQPKVG